MNIRHFLTIITALLIQTCAPGNLDPANSCMAQVKAQKWNAEITAGWNLGNQFECGASGIVDTRI